MWGLQQKGRSYPIVLGGQFELQKKNTNKIQLGLRRPQSDDGECNNQQNIGAAQESLNFVLKYYC